MNRKTKNFQRLLKLPAALGDWTKLNLEDTWLEEMQVAEINYPCFDGLAKDQLKKAHLLHYRLAEKIARKLSDDINMKVELYSVGIQQTSYEEFVKTMQGKAAVKIDFAVNNNKTTTFVGQALASVLLDRLLGGKGKVSENHSFSEIDLEILSAEFQGMLPLYYELWGSQLSEKEDKLKLIFETYKEDKKIGKRDSYIFFSMDFLLDNDQPQKIILGYHNQILKVLLQKEEVSEHLKGQIGRLKEQFNQMYILIVNGDWEGEWLIADNMVYNVDVCDGEIKKRIFRDIGGKYKEAFNSMWEQAESQVA